MGIFPILRVNDLSKGHIGFMFDNYCTVKCPAANSARNTVYRITTVVVGLIHT